MQVHHVNVPPFHYCQTHIFGKVDRDTSEEVMLELIRSLYFAVKEN